MLEINWKSLKEHRKDDMNEGNLDIVGEDETYGIAEEFSIKIGARLIYGLSVSTINGHVVFILGVRL